MLVNRTTSILQKRVTAKLNFFLRTHKCVVYSIKNDNPAIGQGTAIPFLTRVTILLRYLRVVLITSA